MIAPTQDWRLVILVGRLIQVMVSVAKHCAEKVRVRASSPARVPGDKNFRKPSRFDSENTSHETLDLDGYLAIRSDETTKTFGKTSQQPYFGSTRLK